MDGSTDAGGGKHDAFAALQTELNACRTEPYRKSALGPSHRKFLIGYAELNIDRKPGPEVNNAILAIGRVQALYIAHTLATIEVAGNGRYPPFKNAELTGEYRAQQRYILNVVKKAPP